MVSANQPPVVDPFESELKRLAAENRRVALDLAAARWAPRLVALALSIVKDAEEANDVVQDVFIKAMREARLFQEDFRTQAWLFRVTRNLCFNRVRDRRRREHILAAADFGHSAPARQIDVVLGAEQQEELLEAFERLTADHRDILLLRYYEDKSYAEIADALSIKLGTVMSRLSRARGRLLNELDGDEDIRAAS